MKASIAEVRQMEATEKLAADFTELKKQFDRIEAMLQAIYQPAAPAGESKPTKKAAAEK